MAQHHTVLWRRLDQPGHEWARLSVVEQEWRLEGTAVFAHEGRPCRLDYAVGCDADWNTLRARITGSVADRSIDLTVTVDASRHWRLNGAEYPEVAGCIDIDLGFSPSTNLLPIRRLGLDVGDEAEVRAAWLPFPSLEFKPLLQRYIREGEHTYRYESSGGAFVRTLQVNSVGLVIDYPGIWVREGVDTAPRQDIDAQ